MQPAGEKQHQGKRTIRLCLLLDFLLQGRGKCSQKTAPRESSLLKLKPRGLLQTPGQSVSLRAGRCPALSVVAVRSLDPVSQPIFCCFKRVGGKKREKKYMRVNNLFFKKKLIEAQSFKG